jgi:hypothetical protein
MNTLLTVYLTGAATTAVATWGMDKFHPKYNVIQHIAGGLIWPFTIPVVLVLRAMMYRTRRRIQASEKRTAELLAEITGKGAAS